MKSLLCAVLVVMALTTPASAALLSGETIQTTYLYPDTGTLYAGPTNTIVGPGIELTNFAGLANVDFSDTNILITLIRDANVNNVAFDGFEFFDVNGTVPSITSVSLNSATNYAGFTASRVTFDANTIFVNVANLPGLNGQIISVDLNPSSEAPEPSTDILFGLGLLSVGLAQWRRRPNRLLKNPKQA